MLLVVINAYHFRENIIIPFSNYDFKNGRFYAPAV